MTERKSMGERRGQVAGARRLARPLVLVLLILGCGKSPPPVTDLSKAPWLDPKVQAECLSDGDMKIRGLAAYNLGNIGAPAADAIPALEKLAQGDPEQKVRDLSKQAIEKIRAASGGK